MLNLKIKHRFAINERSNLLLINKTNNLVIFKQQNLAQLEVQNMIKKKIIH